MSGWIVLLVIFGLINAISSPNKKKKKAHTKRQDGAQRAAPPKPKTPHQPKQARVPYTKEEWAAYLAEMSGVSAPKKDAPKKAEHAPEPRLVTELHQEMESSFSMEGESHEEHAEHRRRIEEEEALHQQERDAIADLRAANLDKLRAAVVMSEVLGKPVSLRPRTGYHR